MSREATTESWHLVSRVDNISGRHWSHTLTIRLKLFIPLNKWTRGGWGWGRRPGGSDQSGRLSICWLVFKSSIWNLLHMYMTYFPWDRRRGSCVTPLFRNYYISKRMCVSNFIHSFQVIWFQLMCYGLPYFLWQSWENGILISLIFKMYLTVLKVYLIVEASCVCYLN